MLFVYLDRSHAVLVGSRCIHGALMAGNSQLALQLLRVRVTPCNFTTSLTPSSHISRSAVPFARGVAGRELHFDTGRSWVEPRSFYHVSPSACVLGIDTPYMILMRVEYSPL